MPNPVNKDRLLDLIILIAADAAESDRLVNDVKERHKKELAQVMKLKNDARTSLSTAINHYAKDEPCDFDITEAMKRRLGLIEETTGEQA